MKHWRILLLGLVVSLLAFRFISSEVDGAELGRALSQARYGYLLPAAALLLAGLVARAFRWRGLLGGGLPLGRAFNIMNVAYLINGVLPLRVGEVARVYLATRGARPVPVFQTASTILVERLLDLLAVVMLLALALAAGPVPDSLRAVAAVAGAGALAVFVALALLAGQRATALRLLAALVGRFDRADETGKPSLVRRAGVWFVQFLDGLLPLAQPRALLAALGWTAAAWALSVAAGYVLMYAFYDTASWAATWLYIAAAAFSIAVPAVPGNLGTYEASILLALGVFPQYSAAQEVATAFALVVHGVNLAVHVSTGVVGFLLEGISLDQLSRGVRQMRD